MAALGAHSSNWLDDVKKSFGFHGRSCIVHTAPYSRLPGERVHPPASWITTHRPKTRIAHCWLLIALGAFPLNAAGAGSRCSIETFGHLLVPAEGGSEHSSGIWHIQSSWRSWTRPPQWSEKITQVKGASMGIMHRCVQPSSC
jgi:hypothetical protein